MFTINGDLGLEYFPKNIEKPLIIEKSFGTMALTYYNDEWYILGVSSSGGEHGTFSFPKGRSQIIDGFIENTEETNKREMLQEAGLDLDVLEKIGGILHIGKTVSFKVNQEFKKEYSNKTVNLTPKVINFGYKKTEELIKGFEKYDEADNKKRIIKLINIKDIDIYFKHEKQVEAFYNFRESLFKKEKYGNGNNEKNILKYFEEYKKRAEEILKRKKVVIKK